METVPHDRPTDQTPPPAPRFRWDRCSFWVPACLAYGGLVGWVAVLVERFRAPAFLFPIFVGLLLGASLAGMSRVSQVGNRVTVLLGTVLAASAAGFGQHYVSYRVARREAAEDARTYQRAAWLFHDKVLGDMPLPPDDFLEYLRWDAARGSKVFGIEVRGAVVWLIWAMHGLLVLVAALAVVVPSLKKPYCDRCRSWFATTRRGPVALETARRLAGEIGAELPDEMASARYRLSACSGGCGPTRLELRLETPDGEWSSKQVWLDHERRNHVVRALDEGQSPLRA